MNDDMHDELNVSFQVRLTGQPGTLSMPRRPLSGASPPGRAHDRVDAMGKPTQKILPHVRRPEDLVPGRPIYFATSLHYSGAVEGLLIESQGGRRSGRRHPQHPHSQGSTSGWAQASFTTSTTRTGESPQAQGR